MRMSCNGCRVLRKGCSDDCTIRPCLQWIKSADAQANATLFLAKFYGRAGLLNLIDAGPEHLRPAIFRSLLYEACGRIVNPIFGSVGLLWAGNWAQCQETVDAVLQGSPIPQNPSSNAPAPHQIPPLSTYDIRHVSKDTNPARDPTKLKTRTRFKRSVNRASSHDSRLSQLGSGDTKDDENMSIFSVETVEGSLSNRTKLDAISKFDGRTDDSEVGLELTLGLNYVSHPHVCMGKGKVQSANRGLPSVN